MKYKLKLRQHEYDTLLELMKAAVQWLDTLKTPTDKLIGALLLSFYSRLYNKSLIRQPKYTFNIPVTEALAFMVYWTKTPVGDFITSTLVNRIIGEIDKKYA